MDFQCCSVECHAQKGERMLKYLNNSHRYPDSSGSKHWSACCTVDQVAYTNSATWHLGLHDTFNCKSDLHGQSKLSTSSPQKDWAA